MEEGQKVSTTSDGGKRKKTTFRVPRILPWRRTKASRLRRGEKLFQPEYPEKGVALAETLKMLCTLFPKFGLESAIFWQCWMVRSIHLQRNASQGYSCKCQSIRSWVIGNLLILCIDLSNCRRTLWFLKIVPSLLFSLLTWRILPPRPSDRLFMTILSGLDSLGPKPDKNASETQTVPLPLKGRVSRWGQLIHILKYKKSKEETTVQPDVEGWWRMGKYSCSSRKYCPKPGEMGGFYPKWEYWTFWRDRRFEQALKMWMENSFQKNEFLVEGCYVVRSFFSCPLLSPYL